MTARRRSLVKRALRPLRRASASFALVGEEASLRIQADQALGASLERRLDALSQAVEAARAESRDAVSRVADAEARAVQRLEVLLSDVLRRSEATDARLATDLQRASEHLERQALQVAALTRIVGGPTDADTDVRSATPLPVSAYTLFEEIERGGRDEVMSSLHGYLPYFTDAEPVVDLGCGRGEFLELAQQQGIPAYGVDVDPSAVEHCLALGLKARCADAVQHLAGLPADSLGGVFSAQVVEHLPPEQLWPLLEQVARVLRPGGHAVIETPNPATFATHVHSFWRDPTHLRPVPAPALWFAGSRAGLVVADTLYSAYVADDERLSPVPVRGSADERLAEAYNRSVTMLNELLYGPQNVAVVLRKPPTATGG